MRNINRIRIISISIFIITFVSLNLCLLISINYDLLEGTIFTVDQLGRSGFSIPYIDGSLSISRTARTFPAYLVFKPAMFITSILLILYWRANNKLIQTIDYNFDKNKYFLFFGVGSALFLIIHSLLLGIKFDIDLYKFKATILSLLDSRPLNSRNFLIAVYIAYTSCVGQNLESKRLFLKYQISLSFSNTSLDDAD